MSADDIELHALPMYHCAQHDAFLPAGVYPGATSVIPPGADPAAARAVVPEDIADLALDGCFRPHPLTSARRAG
jgi:fatty-acyl-CoA synthase